MDERYAKSPCCWPSRRWSFGCGGGSGGGGSYTTASHTTTAETGGTISPASTTADDGVTANFTEPPDSSDHIDSTSGCGGSLSGNTYTTGAITADCTVTACFAIDTYTVGCMAASAGWLTPPWMAVLGQCREHIGRAAMDGGA